MNACAYLGNGLCGECPSEICNLIHLEVLDLSHNFIRGKLPNMIGNMIYLRHLKYVDLPLNRLSHNVKHMCVLIEYLFT
jgi:hypothetical protein